MYDKMAFTYCYKSDKIMKYYLYVLDTDKRIECGKEIFQLNNLDHIFKNGVMYEVEGKLIDYDEKFIDVNVHVDE